MAILKKSPQRHTFQKEKYLERQVAEGKDLNDTEVQEMLEYYSSIPLQIAAKEADPEWAKHNLEYDLRSTQWIVDKAKSSERYSQNLYAALCNNDFISRELWPQLKEQTWSCSWRYAGGIIADMLEEGDYIDWYCSGIRDIDYDEAVNELFDQRKFVNEGFVTDEIREDLNKLGWIVV